MDELEISLVLRYSVPKNGLTINGILRGLEKDKDVLLIPFAASLSTFRV
ncbi:MAG: hypothetical protein ACE5OR_12215 [bacterium]